MISLLTCLVLNAGALFVAIRFALAAGSDVRCSRLVLSTLSGYVVVIHTAVLLAGLLGWLTIAGLATVVAAAVAVAWWLGRSRVDEPTRAASVLTITPAMLFAPVLAAITAVAWMWPHLVDATWLWIWDDYTYHMVYPALWLRERAIAAVTPVHAFTMQAWYPMSAGVVATWFMAPFSASRGESLAWVSLTGPVYAGIVISGAAELAGRLGSRRPFTWAIPVVLFATSQRTPVMASSFSDADLALAAALFGALVFAIPRSVDESARMIVIDAWYAASLTGFAVGVKASAVPTATIVLLVMVLRARRRIATRIAAIFAVSWIVTAGYWYARNVVHTGNPVYPAAFLSQPGTTFPLTTLREYAQHYGVGRTVGDAVSVYLDWPKLHGALALIGLVGLAGWLVTVGVKTRSERAFAFATLAIVVVTLGLLPITPFSAGNAMTFVSGFVHWDSMRYVALLTILGWVALGFLVGAGVHPSRTIMAIAITAAAVLAGFPRSTAMVFALAVPGAVIAALVRSGADRRLAPVALVIGGLIAAALGAWQHGAKSAATAAAFHREPLFGAAAAALDRLPDGTRVAVFGDQWIYPAFGNRYHLIPVRLDGDGRIATRPVGDAMAPGPLTVDAPTLWGNLTASRVDVVAVVHLPHPGRSPEWPQQHRALEALGARLLHRDGAVAIWALSRLAK